ncbi:hypothetical protein SH1V18_03860 [Vallitalea longa]|uniref:Uncharacterized protein n=1 Tax=Vallitalea longa TaxID=2936439 RepID=A0A9W5Y8E3_9FIRM|nr:hypothetical protein [Vallitalea longa]GKX27906.1 hypothetical protein SH1V18_03860 [Vallitalea longa]
MKSTEYTFNIKELKNLLKKKKCPYCGSTNISKRVVREYQGRAKSKLRGNEFNDEDLYKGTLVYQCQECKKEFLLEALSDEEKLTAPIPSNKFNENENKVEDNNKMKNYVKKFFKFTFFLMLLILLQISIQEKNMLSLLIGGPIVIGMYFLTTIFTK